MMGSIGVGRPTTIETEPVNEIGGPSPATSGNEEDFDKLVNGGDNQPSTAFAASPLTEVQSVSSSDNVTAVSEGQNAGASNAGSLSAPMTENLSASGEQGTSQAKQDSSSQSSPGDKILNSLADGAHKIGR